MRIKPNEFGCDSPLWWTVRLYFCTSFLYVYLYSVYTKNILSFFSYPKRTSNRICKKSPSSNNKHNNNNTPCTNDILWKWMVRKKREQTQKPILINNASAWPILHGKWHVLNAIGRWFAKNSLSLQKTQQINSIFFV